MEDKDYEKCSTTEEVLFLTIEKVVQEYLKKDRSAEDMCKLLNCVINILKEYRRMKWI